MDSSQLEGLISGCVFDMCALEGNEKQDELRCGAFETFTSQCYDIFNTNNIGTVIEWRNFTNCRKLKTLLKKLSLNKIML